MLGIPIGNLLMSLRFLFAVLFLSLISSKAIADEACLPIFPAASNIYTSTGEELILPDFQYSGESATDETSNSNFSLGAGEYKNVTVTNDNTLTFTGSNGVYLIENLVLNENTTIAMAPGDYYIDAFNMTKDSTIELTGSGTVRVFVNSANIQRNARINSAGSKDLVFISYGNLSIDSTNDSNSRIKGVFYAVGSITLGDSKELDGAITAANVNLGSGGTTNYDNNYVVEPDFIGMCAPEPEPSTCSPYVGGATINEFYKASGNGQPVAVEVSLIDGSIPDTVYDNWTYRVCNSGSCKDIPLSDMNDTTSWIYSEDQSLRDFLDFKNGFDVGLLDENDAFIDYIQVENFSGQNFTDTCSYEELAYVFPIPTSITNGTVVLLRTPDSTGLWIEDKNTNKYPQTPGESNDSILLKLNYLFNEGTGQLINDEGDDNRDGVLGFNTGEEAKDPSWQCEATGAYLSFDNSDKQRVTIEDDNDFDPPTEASVAFWIKMPQIPAANEVQRVFGLGDGFEARWDNRGQTGGYLFFDINVTGSNNDIRTSSPITTTNTWIHFAFTSSVSTGQWKLYINGELDNFGTSSSLSAQPSNDLYIGGSPWKKDSDEYLLGSLDDFRIYSGILSNQEVIELAANPPLDCEFDDALAYYSFEQENFDSNVQDFSGRGNHGTNDNGSSVEDGKYCRGFYTNGWNNTSITDNAFDTNLDMNDDVGTIGTVNFWYNKNTDWNQGGGTKDRTLFDASTVSDGGKYFYLKVEGDGRLSFKFENENDNDFTIREDDGFPVRSADTWYYISVTWDLSEDVFQVYVNGALVARELENDNDSNTDYDTDGKFGELGSLVFGDNSSTYAQAPFLSASGYFDEVRIYNEVRTQTQIQTDMTDNSCEEGIIDHYEVHYSRTAFTCEPALITVKACVNDFDIATSCDESAEAVNLTLVASNTDTINQDLSFNGSIDTNLSYTLAEDVTLSINGADPSATESYECIKSGVRDPNCNLSFVDSGFRFFTSTSEQLPTQLSGKPSNVGYNARDWKVQAIQKNTTTGVCEGVFTDEVSIALRAECTSPTSCGSLVSLDAKNGFEEIETNTSDYSDITLNFGNNSIASFDFVYPDAGQMQLEAQYELPDDEGNPSGDFMLGESNTFVVKPFGFYIDKVVEAADTDNENLAATDALGSKFISAGTQFNLNVIAKQWVPGNDLGTGGKANNGINDDGDDLSGNGDTPNFNDVVELTHTLVAPASADGGDEGILTVTDNQGTEGIFSAGVATLTAKYSEVGIIELLVNDDGAYIDGVTGIRGNEPYVGRFIPAYFEQTVKDEGDLTANHNDSIGLCSIQDWAYAGQQVLENSVWKGSVKYADEMEPVINLYAYNADGELTKNYTLGESDTPSKDFMKLTAKNVYDGLIEPTHDAEQLQVGQPSGGATVEVGAYIDEGELVADPDNAGIMQYTYSSNDHFTYEHSANSKLSPFWAELPFEIREEPDGDDEIITDSDGVTLGFDTNEPTKRLIENFTAGGSGEVEIYFGRWFIENAYGPETSNLLVPMFTQTYNGTGFITNIEDSCTVPEYGSKTSGAIYDNLTTWDYRLVDKDSSDGLGVGDTDIERPVPLTRFIEGEYRNLIFSAPQNNKQGALQMEYGVPSWLKFDWQGNGLYTDNPTAILTFGRYRGNDRLIFWREVSN